MKKKNFFQRERHTKINDKSRYQKEISQNKIEQKEVLKNEIKNEGVAGK